jgi:LacI family transcriptional regulator
VEREFIESLFAQSEAGIIWAPCTGSNIPAVVKAAVSARTPLVVVDRFETGCPAAFVYTDDVSGEAEATRYVIAQGHRRVALLMGDWHSQTMAWRKEGFLSAVDAAGIPRNEVTVIETDFAPPGAYEAAKKLLSQSERPTAVLCTVDDQALAVLNAARDLGIRVPQELRIIGYGDYLPSYYSGCALSTVTQDRREMAERAVNILVEEMHDDYQPRHRSIRLPAKLAVRDT